ncbi:cell division protein FtsK [Chelativorans sp. ZYF759]|uniref:FtsK/SpoIIIE family DNA translocase n=1 Tax=Chelativorans sp. ZYF759 TaxID=2692213 RepID=UPI00145DC5B3|nr:DNA translocase FtsK [Chelativorans sp. ZYF759]NMG38113.1 cell division protein FtsK [Chelativorans sp. ZYF759]
MGFGASALLGFDDSRSGLSRFLRRLGARLLGLALIAGVGFTIASLATWNVADPSFSHATNNPVSNAMGYPGAVLADLAMQFLGLASVFALIPAVLWGLLLLSGREIDRRPRRALAWAGAAILAAGVAGCVEAPPTWPLPTGLGGVFGDLVLALPARLMGGYPSGLAGFAIAAVLLVPTLWLGLFGAAVLARPQPAKAKPKRAKRQPVEEMDVDDEEQFDDEEDDEDDRGTPLLGAVTHWWLSGRAFIRRRMGDRQILPRIKREAFDDGLDELELAEARRGRMEPGFEDASVHLGRPQREDDEDTFDDFSDMPMSDQPVSKRVDNPVAAPKPGARVAREAQGSLIRSEGFEMPSLHFLAEPKNVKRDPSLSKDALEQNARLLEGVLEDFGVKGEIIHVRPGPVVTLYELEPAPGIKSSRVIGLADDIARSMSAIACRVAVVPGRNAIGIELPNSSRETVFLRELLASRDFETTKTKLALALGKSINGESVIADIAKMPHLLVAGTTGSGKSVAINTMILSILYRMKPEECRLIMIDPKMLELSVYDGIPHLLTPVVTDPKKAVVALKWTVREMEDRYRKMSKLGVRNIDGYNQRVGQAEKKGEPITRTVQTGFDRETGEAIYETEHLEMEPMPYIVVIIDEMADLMMVAGKDIEGAVQRLAQMARAAGIHVIMATQRPSVDVITGTIKANFPTRISFQVTSKIDSRTILGEQGAEQLLGQGDMLFMLGGGRIQRVHGPFVSDEEVEQVVAHLKTQGVPDYLDAITEDEDDEDGGSAGGGSGSGGNFEDSDDPYDQAVSVVLRDGKASTSYIQRRLGIGYNRAASIIERMEQEGIVGPANHAGKREILVPTEEEAF